MEKYYIESIESLKEISKIFGLISIPSDRSIFIPTTLFLSLFIELTISTYFISSILAIVICYEVYRKNKLKLEMIEFCLIEESFLQEELTRHGVGEFFMDSPYVTDADRDYIFKDSLAILKRNRYFNKIKDHSKFIFSILVSYIVCFILLNWCFN